MISDYDFNQFFLGADISEDDKSIVWALTVNRSVECGSDVPYGAKKQRAMMISCPDFVFVVVRHNETRITVMSTIVNPSNAAVASDLQAITTLHEFYGT